MGFVFADEPGCSPVALKDSLELSDPRNRNRIFPIQGGEQLNTDPLTRCSRWVINFADFTLDEASKWPDLLGIVREKVKPERDRLGDNGDARRRKTNWWRWGQYSHQLFGAIVNKSRVFAASQVSSHLAFAEQPSSIVFAHTMCIAAMDQFSGLACIQSRPHEVWARFFASTLEDRLRYTPSDCFETFPFPRGWETDAALEDIGTRYHDLRAEIMKARWEGLTKTYNRFHDPQCTDEDIEELRALHAEMDRAVLAAYGWTDLDLTTDFHPEHADEPDGKKRLRWSDGTRDAVLGRLLALNAERAAEERGANGKGGR
jgi:hypothetical protein